MLVVHGAWVDGRLGVWAEDTARGAVPASRAALRPHPFAAPATTLAEALRGSGTDGPGSTGAPAGPVAGAEERELTIRLPGSAGGPLPSPESGLASRARSPRILTWRVPALLLPPAGALHLLGALTGPDTDTDTGVGVGVNAETGRGCSWPNADDEAYGNTGGPEWGPGLSLRYLSVVAEHARSLVRRGRVLPGLVVEKGVPAARWRPVLTGADRAALRAVAAAMPPVCRAVPEERPSKEVLTEALNGLVDGVVRLSLPGRLTGAPSSCRQLRDC